MISTGDTAFVLKQQTSRTASAFRPPAPSPGLPVPGHHHPRVAAHPTLALATACAPGLKG
jgi:hypothetical protein